MGTARVRRFRRGPQLENLGAANRSGMFDGPGLRPHWEAKRRRALAPMVLPKERAEPSGSPALHSKWGNSMKKVEG
jgi:hypothetical protein